MESSKLQHMESKLSGEVAADEDEKTAVDHKRGGWSSFPFITANVIGLMLAAGGWSANLIVFMISEFNMKSINATQINNIIQGCNSLLPIVGAIIADSFLGPFLVVAIFSFVSLLGVTMLTLVASIHSLTPPHCNNNNNTNGSLIMCSSKTPSKLQYMVLYSALALSSIGVGGTRFTVATMGADQFDKAGDQAVFFNWYFVATYVSAALSFTATIYIEDNVSWGLGLGICAAANAIGLALFLLGRRFYRRAKPKGSPFTTMARVLVAAVRKKESVSVEGQVFYHGSSKMPHNFPTKTFRFLNRAALKTEDDTRSDNLDARSWKLCTVEEVEDLKTLIKIIPLWSTGIFLSTPIGIFSSLTVLQALTMDRHLGPHFKIPAGSFLVFNILATIISLSIVDRFVLPTWQKVIGRALTPLQRVGTGHVLNILGMVSAALVEVKRLHFIETHHLMDQPGSIVPMSALWLVVPLTIVGIGEAFHFPGQVALYYQEFPTSLRSTSTAMISVLIGIGFYLSTAIVDLIRRTTGWLPNNINNGRLDNVFWTLAVIGVVNLGYYLTCAKFFKYKNIENHDQPSGSPVSRG